MYYTEDASLEVKGQQGLIFPASHLSGPATKEFQSSFPFEVPLRGCHLPLLATNGSCPLPLSSILQSPPSGSGLLPILEVLVEELNSNHHDMKTTVWVGTQDYLY